MRARSVDVSLVECNPRLNDRHAGPRVTRSSISAPVQIRGYPRAAVDYDAPQCGIKEPCVLLREGSLAEAMFDARRPPGLALLISDYMSGFVQSLP